MGEAELLVYRIIKNPIGWALALTMEVQHVNENVEREDGGIHRGVTVL